MKVGDESMSVIRFWTAAKWDLHHLSYILRKLEPLGADLRTVVCSAKCDLVFIELHRVK